MAKKERKLDRRGIISYVCFGLVMMLLTYLLVAHTPLRRTIPGYPSRETQLAAIENYQKIDSLEKVIRLWAFQVANIQRVATGREPLPLDSMRLAVAEPEVDGQTRAAFSRSDSLLRAGVEQIDQQKAAQGEPAPIEALQGIKFSRPLKGTIRSGFTRTGSHPYIEVGAPSGTKVAAILDGTVEAADWSPLEGCTIRIRHENDLVSIYRHAQKLLKSAGDQVKAGTDIAVVGETGELSEAHILLELRYKNQAIDPAPYLSF